MEELQEGFPASFGRQSGRVRLLAEGSLPTPGLCRDMSEAQPMCRGGQRGPTGYGTARCAASATPCNAQAGLVGCVKGICKSQWA